MNNIQLKDRCAIITGASHGLGFEIAKQFVEAGASLMICAREAESLFAAQAKLQSFNKDVKILAEPIDVSDPKQVESLVSETLNALGTIDILVANAGILGATGPVEENDWEVWSHTIEVNLKGVVLTCRAVLSHFKQKKYGKIIVLSGGGATKPMPYFSAYAVSKAGVVRFAETLSEEVKSFHIDVNALAPGALNTRFLEEVLEAGPETVGEAYYLSAQKQKASGGAPLSQAAALCTFLASPESDGITGKLISAVWDPWKKLSEFKEKLKQSDIYTLRRIVPADRGQDWECA